MIFHPFPMMAVPLFLTGLACLILGLIVLLNSPRRYDNASFCLLSFTAAVWCILMGVTSLGISAAVSALCAKWILAITLLIPYFFLIFSLAFPKASMPFPRSAFFLITLPIPFLFYLLLRGLILETVITDNLFLLNFRPQSLYYIVYYLVYFSAALGVFFYRYGRLDKRDKIKYSYFIFGLFFASIFGLLFNVVFFHIFKINELVYLGPLMSIFMILPTAYAILKYRIMDINLVIKKTTAYSLVTSAIIFVYILVVMSMEFIFRSIYGFYSFWAAVPAALIIAVTFAPLRDRFQLITDRLFFHRTIEYQKVIKEVTRLISSVTDLNTLFQLIDQTAVRAMSVRDVAVLLLEENENHFLVEKTNGLADEVMCKRLSLDNPLAAYLREKEDAVVMDELKARMASGIISPPEKEELDRVCSELKSLNASVAIPSFIKDKLVGILCLGEKLSGEPYSPDDLELLLTMASEAGIAIENAKLYRDITATRDYLNNLIQNSEDAIVTLDLDGKILTWNEGARKIFGYEASEIIGKPLPDVADDEFRENLNRILKGESLKTFETRAKNKNGSEVPLLLTASPACDSQGKIIGIFTIMKDLTERKRTEEALKKVNECFVSFGADSSENIKKITQTVGEMLNATFALYNRKEGTLLVTMAGWKTPPDLPPSDKGEGRICFDVIGRGGEDPIIVTDLQNSEYFTKDPNVKKYGLQTYVGYPVKLQGQTVASLCAVFQSKAEINPNQLTLIEVLGRAASVEEERQRAESALKQSQEQLMLSERLASLGRIAAGVAHELNNPLTGVLGMSQLLLEETKKDDPKREELEIIEDSALRCKHIIQSLLSFAQKSLPEFRKIDIREPIEQSLRLMKKQLTLKAVRVKMDIPPFLAKIEADSGQLSQVFLNLLYNSIEAVKQKGIIKIQAQEDKGNNHLVLTFEDNGAGIDAEYLPHIFEPFFTTKKKAKGTGLGLSITYGIIQAHNGIIECRSKKGEGTTFTLTLPINQSGKKKDKS